MGRLIVVVVVGALMWVGWWAFGSFSLDRNLTIWVDERRAEGWAADVGDIEVQGFPNRFDTTLTDVRLADPETGVAWRAPFLQLLALAYRPHQVIAALPNEHVLSTPIQTLTLSHDQARGSIFLEPSPKLPLDRSTIVVDALQIRSTLGWQAALDQARIASEQVPAVENAHRLGAELTGFALPEDLKSLFDPADLLPEKIERMRLDVSLGFTEPWDRRAIEDARPQITNIDLDDLSANWGSVTLRAAGQVVVDASGIPSGDITVKAVDWKKLLDMSVATGLLPDDLAPSVENALQLLAALSGPPDTIDAPLTFRGGGVFLGPFRLGDAPRIVIR